MTDALDLNPTRTALLVLDYQNAFVPRLPDHEALLKLVNAAVAGVRARGGHIGWVRVGFDDTEFDAIPPTSIFARFTTPDGRAQLHADAPGTQIHGTLDLRPNDIVVRKTRVGAFSTTDLGQQLADREVSTIILAGINTSGAVLSTVREAIDRDYRIVVLSDASADPDVDTHEFLLSKIFGRFATIIEVKDMDSIWA